MICGMMLWVLKIWKQIFFHIPKDEPLHRVSSLGEKKRVLFWRGNLNVRVRSLFLR